MPSHSCLVCPPPRRLPTCTTRVGTTWVRGLRKPGVCANPAQTCEATLYHYSVPHAVTHDCGCLLRVVGRVVSNRARPRRPKRYRYGLFVTTRPGSPRMRGARVVKGWWWVRKNAECAHSVLGCGVNGRTHTPMDNVDPDIRTHKYMLGANVIGSRCRAASLPSGLAPHAPRHDRIRGITPKIEWSGRHSQRDA